MNWSVFWATFAGVFAGDVLVRLLFQRSDDDAQEEC